jgi:hypothetical protein
MKKQMLRVILILLMMAISVSIAFAQGPTKGEPVILKGKIDYMDRMGGYYLQTEKPPTALWIDNQNPKLLKKLQKAGKTLTIEGRFTVGADHLFIEKIDGKPYSSK